MRQYYVEVATDTEELQEKLNNSVKNGYDVFQILDSSDTEDLFFTIVFYRTITVKE